MNKRCRTRIVSAGSSADGVVRSLIRPPTNTIRLAGFDPCPAGVEYTVPRNNGGQHEYRRGREPGCRMSAGNPMTAPGPATSGTKRSRADSGIAVQSVNTQGSKGDIM